MAPHSLDNLPFLVEVRVWIFFWIFFDDATGGLNFGNLSFGPDGNLYVSNFDGVLIFKGPLVPELSGIGDFDGDEDVDGGDFLVWQLDTSVGSLADWEANFGTVAFSSTASTVPEPASIILACATIVWRPRRDQVSNKWGACGIFTMTTMIVLRPQLRPPRMRGDFS